MNENRERNHKQEQHEQKLILLGREQLDLVGVLKVEDFDKSRILLETVLGAFVIKGSDLHIAELLLEEEKLSVHGNIAAMEFVDGDHKSGKKKSLLNRLTR